MGFILQVLGFAGFFVLCALLMSLSGCTPYF